MIDFTKPVRIKGRPDVKIRVICTDRKSASGYPVVAGSLVFKFIWNAIPVMDWMG